MSRIIDAKKQSKLITKQCGINLLNFSSNIITALINANKRQKIFSPAIIIKATN